MAVDFRALLQRNESNFFKPIPLGETGYKLSIQASQYHYCSPREDGLGTEYVAWEVGLLTPEGELVGGTAMPEFPTWWKAGQDVWGYASTSDVQGLIEDVLGGI